MYFLEESLWKRPVRVTDYMMMMIMIMMIRKRRRKEVKGDCRKL